MERSIKVGVQRGGVMHGRDGAPKLDKAGKPRVSLDRVYFLDDDGTKLTNLDAAQQARVWNQAAKVANEVWEDPATAAVAIAYAEHAAGAVKQAAEATNADGTARYNVLRTRAERQVETLEAAFDYVIDDRKSA